MSGLKKSLRLALVTCVFAWAGVASAAPPMSAGSPVCPVMSDTMSTTEYLRALTLDLRGDIPTVAEVEALEKSPVVPSATIDKLMSTFAGQAVRRHRDLLWNAITNVRAPANQTYLRRSGTLYWRGGGSLSIKQRGDRVPCNDKPAQWDDDGQIVYEEMADGTKREGYVMVTPYWAPTTKISASARRSILKRS